MQFKILIYCTADRREHGEALSYSCWGHCFYQRGLFKLVVVCGLCRAARTLRLSAIIFSYCRDRLLWWQASRQCPRCCMRIPEKGFTTLQHKHILIESNSSPTGISIPNGQPLTSFSSSHNVFSSSQITRTQLCCSVVLRGEMLPLCKVLLIDF